MGWMTEHGQHEGYVAAVVADGRHYGGRRGDGTKLWDRERREHVIVPGRVEVVAWTVLCDGCSWQGSRWERVADPADADVAAGRAWSPDQYEPAAVEEAAHAEWLAHVRPVEATGGVREAAREAADARQRLDQAVRAAREAGASWAEIGRAAGVTKQAAHERWGSHLSHS